MSDLSHEDIKNAILHAGETPEQVVAPVDDLTTAPETALPEVPHTPYEGFVGSEPTEEERVGFRAAKDQVHARHRNRTTTPTTQPEHSRRRAVIAGGTVAGFLLAATGGFMAFRGQGDGTPEQPHKTPEASAPVTPGGEGTQWTPELLVPNASDVELSVDSYSDGESLLNAYIDVKNQWLMTGATQEVAENYDTTMTDEAYIETINQPVDQVYVSGLFVDDYQTNPDLAHYVDTQIQQHEAVARLHLLTTDLYNQQLGDIEPYERSYEILEAHEISRTDSEIVIYQMSEQHSNEDMNRAGQMTDHLDGEKSHYTLTFRNVGGVWKISDIQY